MNVFITLVTSVVIIFYLIILIGKKKNNYWKKKNVPYVKPLPILGNYGKHIFQQEYIGELVHKLCLQFPKAPYCGAFFGTEPVLIVQCPDILKQIFTKDFYYFNGREVSKYADREVLTQNVFFSGDDMWKIKRQMLTPLFSTAKMKSMFKLIDSCCQMFEDMLNREIKNYDIIEAKDLSARFMMDCVTSCSFGVNANTMLKPENNVFRNIAREIFNSTNYNGFKLICRSIWPAIFYGLGFQYYPAAIHTFFSKLVIGVFEKRNFVPSTRNDFIDLLLNLKQKNILTVDSIKNFKSGADEKVSIEMNDELLLGQCLTFFGAGFETSSSALSFTLFELAKNPDVQKRAADELDEILRRRGNKLDFECINELPYLEACIYETLRKYPLLGVLTREVMDDYTLPDGLHLEKGVRIHIPVYSMNHKPEYFPEPHAYKPERFLPENRKDIERYTYLPFGEGPRMCIGQRFSKMQMMPGLITFLKRYQVELAEEMPKNLILDSRAIVTQPRDQGLFLKVTNREGWEQRMFTRL